MTVLSQARRMAHATPDSRNRYVDFLRAISIIAVVVGHWLIAAPHVADGEIHGINLLAHSPWTQWLTWAFQVMPVFFMVGGYSNATSWAASRRHGDTYGTWLTARLRRLLLPVAPLVAVWTVLGVVLSAANVDAALLKLGSQSAIIPLWFLAVYVMMVALTPALEMLWDRFGWGSIAGLAAAAAVVDLTIAAVDWIGWLNFGFVWAAVTQIGTAWHRGRIGGRRSLPLVLGSSTLLLLVVALGWYPISMVGVPGAIATNNSPPTLALLLYGLAQTSVLLLIEQPARRWLSRVGIWTGTVLVNGLIMTLYLWHLTAMVLLIGGSLLIGGFGFGLEPGSGVWWLTRPVWLGTAALATIPFLALFRRFDSIARLRDGVRVGAAPAVGVAVASCLGLALLAGVGIGGPVLGIDGVAVALVLGAVAAVRRMGATRPA